VKQLGTLVLGALLAGPAVRAQEPPAAPAPTPSPTPAPPDDTPSIKLGVTLYTDFTYTDEPQIQDADGNQVNPSAFDVSRAYINVTGNLSHLVSFRITPDIKRQSTSARLAAGESVSASTDGGLVYRIKYAFGQVNLDPWTTKGTWVRIGAQQTPVIDFLENVYRYRFQGTMFANRETSPGGQPYLDSSDFGLSGHGSLPKEYGEVHVGYYNGEYFGKNDPNDQKAFQVRGTVRPFASRHGALRGVRLTAFYDADHYLKDAPRNRFLGSLTFEHRHLNAGLEYLRTTDRVSTKSPQVDGEGWSIWVTPRLRSGWEALLRHDHLQPDQAVDAAKGRTIVGVAYWFKTKAASAQAALLADYEQVRYDAALVKPDEKRYALHCLFNF
jgi:hypothetical protein